MTHHCLLATILVLSLVERFSERFTSAGQFQNSPLINYDLIGLGAWLSKVTAITHFLNPKRPNILVTLYTFNFSIHSFLLSHYQYFSTTRLSLQFISSTTVILISKANSNNTTTLFTITI